ERVGRIVGKAVGLLLIVQHGEVIGQRYQAAAQLHHVGGPLGHALVEPEVLRAGGLHEVEVLHHFGVDVERRHDVEEFVGGDVHYVLPKLRREFALAHDVFGAVGVLPGAGALVAKQRLGLNLALGRVAVEGYVGIAHLGGGAGEVAEQDGRVHGLVVALGVVVAILVGHQYGADFPGAGVIQLETQRLGLPALRVAQHGLAIDEGVVGLQRRTAHEVHVVLGHGRGPSFGNGVADFAGLFGLGQLPLV
nr:hypothetical protein [Tanacetum cinerariifolium]